MPATQRTLRRSDGGAAAADAATAPPSPTVPPDKELRAEAERRCTTQQWLRQDRGLVPLGLAPNAVAAAAPFKLPQLNTELTRALRTYEMRRAWLTCGSRHKFGAIAEARVAVLVDGTFDDPEPVIKILEQLAEEQLGDCSRLALMSFDEGGIRRQNDELDVVVVGDDVERQYRVDAVFQWANRLRRGRERHRTHGLVGNVANETVKGMKRMGQAVAGAAVSAGATLRDIGMGMTGAGPKRAAFMKVEFQEDDIAHPDGPDLIAALAAAMDLTDVDGLYFVVGSHPKYKLEAVQPHLATLFGSPAASIHIVDYSVASDVASNYLRDVVQLYDNACDLANATLFNRYLKYSLSEGTQLDGSDDLELINVEIARAREALGIVKDRINESAETDAAMATATAAAANAIATRKKKTPKKRIDSHRLTRTQMLRQAGRTKEHKHLQRQGETEQLLSLQQKIPVGPRAADPSGDELTSQEWIAKFGFRKGLTPYQEFRSVAYSASKPGLYMGRKYKSLGTMEWEDGSTRNVHIDVGQIADYRERLMKRMQLVNERIAWLGTGTRRVFGNLAGGVITIVIDTSAAIKPYWTLFLAHLRELFQEHLPHKQWFNLVRYDKRAESFKRHVVQVSEASLLEAWKWIEEWDNVGISQTRDIMAAVELATDDLQPQHHGEHSIYLICAGEPNFLREEPLLPTDDPDTPGDAKPLFRFVQQLLSDGTSVFNTIAYNCYESPKTVFLLRRLAKESGGTFRLCIEDGTIHDDLHTDAVSWSTDTVQVLRDTTGDEGADAPVPRDRPNHYFEVSEWVRLGKYNRDGPEVADKKYKICLCDGDDAQLLRLELERAAKYLSTVQDLLDQLPPEFADVAETMLAHTALGVGTRKGKSRAAERRRASTQKEKTVPLDILLKQAESTRDSRAASATRAKMSTAPADIGATKTSRLRQSLTRAVDGKASPKSRKSTATRTADAKGSGVRKGRYMVANSTETGRVQVTVKADPEIGVGPARPLPKEKRKPAILPKKEVPMSSDEWLRRYGLRALRLDIKTFLTDNAAALHSKSSGSEKKYGSETSRQLGPGPWAKYISALKDALDRYGRRVSWLLSGTNAVFGCLVEKNVVLAVDTSGSMHPHMPFLKEQLGEWLRTTVYTACHTFNVVQFNSQVKSFTGEYKCLIEASEDTCACAALWVEEFDAEGGTDVIGALEESTCNPGVDAVYLLSDGLPDHAPMEVLERAELMSKERKFRVHTIAFNADSEDAQHFLRELAARCQGRYHQFTSVDGLGEEDAATRRADDEARSDDVGKMRKEMEKVEAAIRLGVAEQMAATESIERMLSTRAPRTADTPKWIPSSSKLEACDEGKTHNKWGKTSVSSSGRSAKKVAATMQSLASGTLADVPKDERPSLYNESRKSWARASKVPRAEPEPTKSSLLLQTVTLQKVRELDGGMPADPAETGVYDIDTDEEDNILEHLPDSELYAMAGLDPPAEPRVQQVAMSGRGDVHVTKTGLVSVPKKPPKAGGIRAENTAPRVEVHRGLINGISTQVTPTEVAEYVTRWSGVSVDPVFVDMPYDTVRKRYSGIAYINFVSRRDLLKATRMKAGQSNPATLHAEAVKNTAGNVLTPDRSAWLRRTKRVEELLRAMRITVATAPTAGPELVARGIKARGGDGAGGMGGRGFGDDFFTTAPVGLTHVKKVARTARP